MAENGLSVREINFLDPLIVDPRNAAAADLGGGVKMELVWVPTGSFLMGSPDSESGRTDDEGPVHTVELDGFWMGKYEVTVSQFRQFVEAASYQTDAEKKGESFGLNSSGCWEVQSGLNWRNPGFPQEDNHPVVHVSWNEARSFCDWLSRKEGKEFRLPTEAEWEYACRAGSTTRFCFGDSDGGLHQYGWFSANSGGKTHPVGEKKANEWGLYDMHGNVWEWCGDLYADKYEAAAAKNPQGASSGPHRVLRGGGAYSGPQACRSAYRTGADPTGAYDNRGFRVVCEGENISIPPSSPAPNVTPSSAGGAGQPQTGEVAAADLGGAGQPQTGEVATADLGGAGQPQTSEVAAADLGGAEQPQTGEVATTDLGGAEQPQTGEVATADLGGGVKIDLVWVPAGCFQMGSPDAEQDHQSCEGPVHTVELDGFWMGKYEVTQEQYEAVMGKNPSKFKGAKNPVEQVSWNDAVEFCRNASQKTGKDLRLPTEAEWEYACRAGSTTRFCFGDSDTGLGEYAWYDGNSGKTTHPVGEKKENNWDLYDMHGNVWEWCGDLYADRYEAAAAKNPQGASSGPCRVLRGGGWSNGPQFCRSATRDGGSPSRTGISRGFRVVCDGVSSR